VHQPGEHGSGDQCRKDDNGEKAMPHPAADRRRRLVALTAAGQRLTEQAPLAGPVRLRQVTADAARLRRLADAFTDAIDLFGLEAYAHDRPADAADHRPWRRTYKRWAYRTSRHCANSAERLSDAGRRDCTHATRALRGALDGVRWTTGELRSPVQVATG
jgi:hypothetical protein